MTRGKQPETDAYQRAEMVARDIRQEVAKQLHDLLIERESMGSEGEVGRRLQGLSEVLRQLQQARGRQQQAAEMGLPLAPAVQAEREARELLRQSVMGLGAACGAWAASLDFEELRNIDGTLSGPASA